MIFVTDANLCTEAAASDRERFVMLRSDTVRRCCKKRNDYGRSSLRK